VNISVLYFLLYNFCRADSRWACICPSLRAEVAAQTCSRWYNSAVWMPGWRKSKTTDHMV